MLLSYYRVFQLRVCDVSYVSASYIFPKLTKKTDARIKYGQVEISMPIEHSSPAYGSEVLGKDSLLPNLLEMNPDIRELKQLLIGFLSSCFNLLSFFRTAL